MRLFFNFNSKTDKLVCHSAHEIKILKNVQEHLITNFSLVFFKEPSLIYNLAFIFVLKKRYLVFVNDPTGRHATVITPWPRQTSSSIFLPSPQVHPSPWHHRRACWRHRQQWMPSTSGACSFQSYRPPAAQRASHRSPRLPLDVPPDARVAADVQFAFYVERSLCLK